MGSSIKKWSAGAGSFLLIGISVPALPGVPDGSRNFERVAAVSGAVGRPGSYPLAAGEKLSSLVDRAGGFADNAFLRGAGLFRRSAGARNRILLDDSISRLEREALFVPGDEEAKRGFLRILSELPPGTRIPVRLAYPRLMKGSADDLPIEDGDELFVPAGSVCVTVVGAVRSPGPVPLERAKEDPEDLVGKAGGYAEDADRNHAYLLKAEGSAVPLSRGWIRWNPLESRWEIPRLVEAGPAAEAGDTVVVPKKPVAAWARGIRDLAGTLREIHLLTGSRIDPP